MRLPLCLPLRRVMQYAARKGASYSGTVTDPNNGKVYTCKASVRASSMSLSGCVLGFLCKSETWTRR